LGSSPSAEQILTNTAKQLEQEQKQQYCKGNSFARRWRTNEKNCKEVKAELVADSAEANPFPYNA
jgi:hypothetical protein